MTNAINPNDAGDIFDNPPVGPVGVHRGKRPLGVRMMPSIIVVLLAVACGLGAWGVFSGQLGKIQWPGSTPAASQSADKDDAKGKDDAKDDKADDGQKDDADTSSDNGDDAANGDQTDANAADPNQSGEPTQPETPTEPATPAPTVNKSTAISVINATRIQGHAAGKADILRQAGYTTVSAANPTGSTRPSATVVWYQNETDQATAQDVASTLGISNVQQVQGLASPIVVMLMS